MEHKTEEKTKKWNKNTCKTDLYLVGKLPNFTLANAALFLAIFFPTQRPLIYHWQIKFTLWTKQDIIIFCHPTMDHKFIKCPLWMSSARACVSVCDSLVLNDVFNFAHPTELAWCSLRLASLLSSCGSFYSFFIITFSSSPHLVS